MYAKIIQSIEKKRGKGEYDDIRDKGELTTS